jgi:iron complex transport system permease protein
MRPGRDRVLRTPGGRIALLVDGRASLVCLVVAAVIVALGVLTLTIGDFPLSVAEVARTLIGRGGPAEEFIVLTLRLPRLLTGALIGAALGISGGLLQSLTRNPLGSPDVIGLTTGAMTGALVVILVLHGSMAETALGALIGGCATAVVVYLLAFRGGVQALRLIMVGLGVGAMLLSVNFYLVTRATLQDAVAAQVWLICGLNGRRWEHVVAVGVALAVLAPIALVYGRRLALLELGDDTASALGVPVQRSGFVVLALSVALAAVATAAAGPIGFVALAAPQVARRLTGSARTGLGASALVGALLIVAADLLAQRLFAPTQFPVGITTGALGGLYLAWLLSREWRRSRL